LQAGVVTGVETADFQGCWTSEGTPGGWEVKLPALQKVWSQVLDSVPTRKLLYSS